MQTEQMMVPIDRLIVDPKNVRKGKPNAEADASLAASILAHGILQPLAVRPPSKDDGDLGGDRYRVTGGGRRLRIITGLISDGKLKPDFSIPIYVREDLGDAEAGEASLAENVVRLAMDPVDEVTAFKELADSGLSATDIAFRFGLTARQVSGRLALANLHPELLEAMREEKMSLELAKAYTAGTPEQQIELWKSDDWRKGNANNVRGIFTDDKINDRSSFAQKVGRDAYIAAGGVIEEDLFGNEQWWISTDVIAKLTEEWVEQQKADALAEGFSWALTPDEMPNPEKRYYEYDRVYPDWVKGELTEEQSARLTELSDAYDAFAHMNEDEAREDEEFQKIEKELRELEAIENQRQVYAPELLAVAGVIIDPAHFSVTKGVLQDGVKAPSKNGASSSEDGKTAEKDPLAPSQALAERLSMTLTNSFREAILKDNKVALAFLATVIGPAVSHYKSATPSRIKNGSFENIAESPEDFATVFERNLAMTQEEIIGTIAQHVSASVDVTDKFMMMQGWGQKPAVVTKIRKAIAEATKADPVAHFDARDYFTGSSKTVIEAAMKEMDVPLNPGKKEGLVNQAVDWAERYGWLPWSLRFDGYKLNKPEPAKTGAKDVTKGVPSLRKTSAKEHSAKVAAGEKTPKRKLLKVDDDVIEVLANHITIKDEKWLHFKTQLPRDLYTKVMKVLKEFGGVWLKREKYHAFPEPIEPIIDEVLLTGHYSRTKQDFGQFDTPVELAQLAVEWAEIEDGMSVLEPSAGIGRLVDPIIEAGGWVTAVEVDQKRADDLLVMIQKHEHDAAGYAEVHVGDFMEWDSGEVYDRVVMNPPFAGQADITHVTQAFDLHLAPGGILVAIMSPSFQFRTNKKSETFRKLLDDHEASIENIDEGAFKESGTMIRTVMVKIRKPE